MLDRILEPHDDPEKLRWLPGARLNIAECALRDWDPDAPALLWAAEGGPERLRALTLDQLRRRAYAAAAALRSCGYCPGAAKLHAIWLRASTSLIGLGLGPGLGGVRVIARCQRRVLVRLCSYCRSMISP